MSRQTYRNTMQGFRDVLRVLEPGGELVISEEDSPANCLQLATQLADVGFNDITITPYNSHHFITEFGRYIEYSPWNYNTSNNPQFTHADQSWLALRGAYWSVSHKLDQWGDVPLGSEARDTAEDYWRHAYMMVASKPSTDNPSQ
jgi:hypothetical protein